MNKTFYLTTTTPYVNAEPHVGFASEIVLADVRARYAKLHGQDVVFNTGTDEHGLKIYEKALEEGKDPQTYTDENAAKFSALKDLLNLSYTHFTRTTDKHHVGAAQEMWKRVDANGFIYKKDYKVKYCIGCELEKTDSELENGECPIHPGREVELIEEENYFFAFSKFQEQLLALYEREPQFVVPAKRFNEIKSFIEHGAEDFSISRLAEKMPWGVPVPGDDKHVMYVWFDALTNYISMLGWPEDEKNFHAYWGDKEHTQALQIAGKDNLRQQSAMWQAMLLAADLPPSKQIFINGFISVDGQKMSKSLGNVIAPEEMVDRYGIDGARYLLLTKGNFGEDSDISLQRMDEKYNADLANGLGNLCARVLTLGRDTEYDAPHVDMNSLKDDVERFEFKQALEKVWAIVAKANKLIEEEKPWELKKTDPEKCEDVLARLLQDLHIIATLVEPFLPETSEKMKKALASREKVALFDRV